ncbi:hypothetical protein HID58_047153 [Brassica napus]|uniref:Uncharacterized protein n=1 Tax=Brassica napus TaxID=3708 RepID=A0ABQ8AYE5_BRANA|nr:hypothetical protein HID58_047153 [Brassica napus]
MGFMWYLILHSPLSVSAKYPAFSPQMHEQNRIYSLKRVCKLLNRSWNRIQFVSFFKSEVEADYTMKAPTTVGRESKVLNGCISFLALPFQPLMVSAVHIGMMEVSFAKRVLKDPDLKAAHNVHKMSTLLGGLTIFSLKQPFIHDSWHLAAAIGVGTCNKLLQ